MAGGRAATEAVIQGRAAISVNDPGHPTPPGWVRVALTDVAELGTGHTPSRKHPEYWGGDVPWIGIRDAGAHHGDIIQDTEQHTNELGLANSAARLLPEGTVCLSRTASVGYVVIMGRDMATSQDFVTWTCGGALEPRFLLQALLAEGEDIRRFGEGSTHTTIYFPEVKAFHVDLPPLAEQRRIVAKIDSLSAKSKRARDRLDHVPKLVERYRSAVLDIVYACLGDHVPLEKLVDPDRGIPYGIIQTGDHYEGGIPTVRCGDIKSFRVGLESLKRVSPEIERVYERTRLRGDEVLIAVRGSVGETCVATEEMRGINMSREVAMIPVKRDIDPHFIMYYLASPKAQRMINANVKGVAQQGINLRDLRALPTPHIGIENQRAVVRKIAQAFAWIDRLAAEAVSARKLINRLDQAVLAKAFRGELVPQDPADEPASVLLKRIRAERAETGLGQRRRGRPRALVSETVTADLRP